MLDSLNGETRLFPIIGDPIKHVKIPPKLTRGFEARGHNAVCIPMLVTGPDLDVVMRALARTPNVEGLLVTMPHKFTAFTYCSTSSSAARLLGGVSVIRRNADGSWHGGMLDGLAFVKAQTDAGARHPGARALLVGAGAAGSAIAIALLEAGVRELVINDTHPERVTTLLKVVAEIGRDRVRAGTADPTGFDIVCNATPMGFSDTDPLPIPGHLLTSSMFVGDVIAGHGVTRLLQAARAAGCKTSDGVQMVEAVPEMMLDFLLGQ